MTQRHSKFASHPTDRDHLQYIPAQIEEEEEEADPTFKHKGGRGKHKYDNEKDDHVQELMNRYAKGGETTKKTQRKRSSGEAAEEGAVQSEEERLAKRAKMGFAAPPDASLFKEWKQISAFPTMAGFVEYMLDKLVADWYDGTRLDGAVRVREFEKVEMLARRRQVEAIIDAMPGLYTLLRDGGVGHGFKSSLEAIAEALLDRDYTMALTAHYNLGEAAWSATGGGGGGKMVEEGKKERYLANLKQVIEFGLKRYPNSNRHKNNYTAATIKTAY